MIESTTAVPIGIALAGVGAAAIAACSFTTNEKICHPPADYVTTIETELKPNHGPIYKVGSLPQLQGSSMLEQLQKTAEAHPNQNFLGHRPFDSNGNAMDYVWQSYSTVYQRIQNFAAGLMSEKMLELTADGERPLCLYMKNRPEWVLGQYTAMYCGGFPVALYDTLGANSTQYILEQTQSPAVVCTSAELANVFTAKKSVETLRFVVVVDLDTLREEDVASAESLGLKLWRIQDIEAIGASNPLAPASLSHSDIYCLIYTSGTTGNPKGVPISHQNVMSTYEGLRERLNVGNGKQVFEVGAIHMSYLPLAHCIEHLIHAVMIYGGGMIAFFQGNTLKLTEDLVLARPTIFVTVPRLLNKIYDKVVNGARSAGGLKAWLFDLALKTKLENLKLGYRHHKLFDKLIFSKVQKKVGLDRCAFVVTGSAPLADDVMNFFRILLDCPVHEGYGQSETVAGGSITHTTDTNAGTVGPPLICTEIKLISVPDMGYNVTDTTHGDDDATKIPVQGRGEVCFRGPNVFAGYYKDPAKTAEAIDSDGWLHSGDIAVWTLDGRLKLVDRKKNIFKLSQGEYVAPEKIENILVTSAYVAQPFVYGDSLHSVLVAVIVPEEEALMKLAKSLNVPGTFADVCRDANVVAAVHKDLVTLSKQGKLYGFETVKAIKLHPTPFSVENDMMTPTFKLKRNEAKKAFMHDIDELYLQCNDLVAGHNVHQG